MLKRLSKAIRRKTPVTLLVVGLDNSGKSSLVQHMKPDKIKKQDRPGFEATPTVGFETEEFQELLPTLT